VKLKQYLSIDGVPGRTYS